jgi:16S rRNA (cytosine1402-N4)-methyltransferase
MKAGVDVYPPFPKPRSLIRRSGSSPKMIPEGSLHTAVLLDEVVAALAPRAGGIYVDCTFGRGGHTKALLEHVGEQGRVLALDRDPQAVSDGYTLAMTDERLKMENINFSALGRIAEAEGVYGKVNGILFDLGVSSPQLQDPMRGFSFRFDGPLDMRMDPKSGTRAATWLARASECQISEILRRYGEERFAKRIARAIVSARAHSPIETTHQLANIVVEAVPYRERNKHPATRTFQAMRIFVNRELDELQAALDQTPGVLAHGGRFAVISFHSLEDRIVKRFIRAQSHTYPELSCDGPAKDSGARLRAVGKFIRPSPAEMVRNPRARSAVLRVAEKCT